MWDKLKFEEQQPVIIGNTSAKHMRAELPEQLFGIGIDPGRNFGIAIYNGKTVELFYGTMKQYAKSDRWRYGVEAVDIASNLFNIIKPKKIGKDKLSVLAGRGVVEGAAYKKMEGQVNLAEVRFGFAYGLYLLGIDVRIAPPATIRKTVTGSGVKAVWDWYPKMNKNACDALGIGAYAAGYKWEEK